MEVLLYKNLEYHGLKKQVEKVTAALAAGDFRSAEVKKMPNTGYFRAKLDDKNRLLFKIAQVEGRKYVFVLEVIANHAYDKSRFLNGAVPDEAKLQPVASPEAVPEAELHLLKYVNPKARHFHVLDKILSFDDLQQGIFRLPLPIIVVGSAGSGKTALTLEKMKDLVGDVLYVTLSSFLVESARNMYFGFGYDNERQNIDFLSFKEYLSAIAVPDGREIDYRSFEQWISRYRQAYRIKDAHKLFEEFKGVLTGASLDTPWLSREAYLGLGVRQSVFSAQEREGVYELFVKYIDFLKEGHYYDSNMVAHNYFERVKASYDYVVVDEVQDLTNVQLYLILKSLRKPENFWLCGDSNQIVHPNFFSWANVKTMFYRQDLKGDIIRVLATNYRNTPEVTGIANQLLLVKNARFGSIDRESTYLVKAVSGNAGEVQFYEDKDDIKRDFNKKTSRSTRFAVLVMRNEDKAEARKYFQTPLLFSIQEAKGLEYENIILFNMISGNDKEFRELCQGVSPDDLQADEISYARARDKTDKSLEVYKFYVNSLYVAITRAVSNLYVIESNRKHELLQLLNLTRFSQQVNVKEQASTTDDWQKEARRLEMQGKQEQADAIRQNILHLQPVPWEVLTPEKATMLYTDALNPDVFNKKAKDRLFEYAFFYLNPSVMPQLAALNYKRAERWEKERPEVMRRLLSQYVQDKPGNINPALLKYGPDYRNEFNLTPLMLATIAGAPQVINHLFEHGANPLLADNMGRNAFQLALASAATDDKYISKTLVKVYSKLMPDSINLKIGNRLVKLHNRQMEFFIFNYMVATQRNLILTKASSNIPGFDADDVVHITNQLPDQFMPPYRKKRSYTLSVLSNNEVMRTFASSSCKGLFYRIYRGYYIINPILEIGIGDEWYSYYDHFLRLHELEATGIPNISAMLRLMPQYKTAIAGFLAAPPTE